LRARPKKYATGCRFLTTVWRKVDANPIRAQIAATE
jgi:hypothetical protein